MKGLTAAERSALTDMAGGFRGREVDEARARVLEDLVSQGRVRVEIVDDGEFINHSFFITNAGREALRVDELLRAPRSLQ